MRNDKIIELHKAGLSCADISDQLKEWKFARISRQRVHQIIKEYEPTQPNTRASNDPKEVR